MTNRSAVVGLVAGLVVGAIAGALVWDAFSSGGESRSGRRAASPATADVRGADADLLDVVWVVQTLPDVEPCRMVETFPHEPVVVRAFCSTAGGGELRIVHYNDPSTQDANVASFCELGDGEAFIPSGARWSVIQVPGPSGGDPSLTSELRRTLHVDPVVCPTP